MSDNFVNKDGQYGVAYTNPVQPSFYAYVSSNYVNVTGDNSIYQVGFDTLTYQRGGANFNTGISTFLAPIDGVYQFYTAVSLIGGQALSANSYIELVDSTPVARSYLTLQNGVTGNYCASIFSQVLLTAGDIVYVTVQATDIAGKVLDVEGGVNTSYFCGHFLG